MEKTNCECCNGSGVDYLEGDDVRCRYCDGHGVLNNKQRKQFEFDEELIELLDEYDFTADARH